MLKIKPVNRPNGKGNRYCGPAAISAVTGCTTDEAARVIRHVSGKRSVRGTSGSHLRAALALFGVKMVEVREYAERPTLAAWFREAERGPGVYLLLAGSHWQLVQGRRFVCGITREVVGFTHEKVKRRARVARYWMLASDGVVRPDLLDVKPERNASPWAEKIRARHQACKLAAEHDITIDTSESTRNDLAIWVFPNFHLDDDPLEGDRFCTSWGEVLGKIEVYIEARPGAPANITPAAQED